MTGPHRFDPGTLRAYDIRGIVGETLSEADARALGRAFTTIVAERGRPGPKICVGYDGRVSSPMLEAALVEGLAGAGANVIRVGLGPTPMLYFATKTLTADAGVMVTGSHNPSDYNGFKMVLGGAAFWGEDIQELGRLAAAGAFRDEAGTAANHPVEDAYVARLAEAYRANRGLSVAWDAGNGAAGRVMARLTDALPGHHHLLNETIDGTFPAHHPDPTVPENLEQLIAAVATDGHDLGIAFDGDGDRIGVIDSRGRILWGDQLLCLWAADVLRDNPGATIIADVKASQVLFDEIAAHGGVPLMWRTGHSPIKAKMAETGAPLAGEMSGHVFFADRYWGYDDALYAAVRLLDVLARSEISLADMRDALPQMVNTPELRFDCPDSRKFAVVEEVRARLDAEGARVNAADGVRVTTADGWWLLRASNTQPVLVARCEAAEPAGLDRVRGLLVDQLEKSGVAPPDF
ncbi:MAG: phosphomannomutase/phosphoglucomutase [Alphaproteobacteria bacterium]|jgi:phosphomannomutase|nr:phosphomannomutase/phosphoglucomutase [Alphaproteobacteria bacterium]MDP6516860.1 phosphomannomutase/phosphoglucomutase [Alphaproteobacteria bacterium]